MEVNKRLERVRKLIAMAEHERTDPVEAQAFREAADKIMLEEAIEWATVRDAMPAEARSKPETILVETASRGHLSWQATTLLRRVAEHCRCRMRSYAVRNEGKTYHKVYGFESDIRYVEVLYSTLQLHMFDVLAPRYDSDATLEDNAYRLHNAGFNWLEIAKMMGYRKLSRWDSDHSDAVKDPWRAPDGDIVSEHQIGSRVKRAYKREIARRGEAYRTIAASSARTYRTCAAQGYMDRITQRLDEVEKKRGTGSELVLHRSAADLEEYFYQDNEDMRPKPPKPYEPCPRCEANPSGHCRKHPKGSWTEVPWDERAYRNGVAHANTADLSGDDKVHRPTAKAIR